MRINAKSVRHRLSARVVNLAARQDDWKCCEIDKEPRSRVVQPGAWSPAAVSADMLKSRLDGYTETET